MIPMDETSMLPDKSAAQWKNQRGLERAPPAVEDGPKTCLTRTSMAEDGGIGRCGPWEPVRTDFTPGRENEFVVKWIKSDRIRIKV